MNVQNAFAVLTIKYIGFEQTTHEETRLCVAFDEASYDHTCCTIHTLIDALPSLCAGDDVLVEFVHWNPMYNASFKGVMPGPREVSAQHPCTRDFLDFRGDVHRATR